MVYDSNEVQIVASRPSPPFPRPAKRSIDPLPSPQNLFSPRHKTSHAVSAPTNTNFGSIPQRLDIREFCRSVTPSESSPVDFADENDARVDGLATPAKVPRRSQQYVAGIARLINAWNPEVIMKPAHYEEASALSGYHDEADETPARARTDLVSPPQSSRASTRQRSKQRRTPSQACFSCSQTQTPQWRLGPTGINTLCNVCGLIYAKRLENSDRLFRKSWKRSVKSIRTSP